MQLKKANRQDAKNAKNSIDANIFLGVLGVLAVQN
jgi:hypothetical protein